MCAGVVQRREPDLVDEDEIVTQQGIDDAADGVVGQAAVELLDEVGRVEVADLDPAATSKPKDSAQPLIHIDH